MGELIATPGIRRLARTCALFVVSWTFMLTSTGIAHSTFTATTAASMDVGSDTLGAPSGASAINFNCINLTSIQVKVTWTASSSSWADGYEVFRSLTSGGPYSSVGTVSGQGTVEFIDSAVSFVTPYYYVVQATKSNWRSSNSNQASVTTLTNLCV